MSCYQGRRRSGRCRFGPSVAAVSGPVEEVGAVSEAAAHFIHAGDVDSAVDAIAGDLDIAEEGARFNCSRVGPSRAVVGGVADDEGAPPTLKSFQETYIRP